MYLCLGCGESWPTFPTGGRCPRCTGAVCREVDRPPVQMAKRELLAYLADQGEATAWRAACAFGLTHQGAATALLRLVRQGLATRVQVNSIYRYGLTDRGWERLAYWARLE